MSPCVSVVLFNCLGNIPALSDRVNVCLWEIASPHPVFVLVESEKLLCDAIVLFVSVYLFIQQIFKELLCVCMDMCVHLFVEVRGQLWLSILMEA